MNIMIIDDDVHLLRSLKLILSQEGHTALCLANPLKAIHVLKSTTEIDVLLVDYVMEEMTGVAFLRIASRLLPSQCRIAMMTGHADRVDRNVRSWLNVEALFAKPLELSLLLGFLARGKCLH